MSDGLEESFRALTERQDPHKLWFPPLPGEALQQFEADQDVELPFDLRALYGWMDGAEAPDPSTLVRLWPMEQWQEDEVDSEALAGLRVFHFADWAEHSLEYAVCLVGPEDVRGSVWIDWVSLDQEPVRIADSITEFLEAMVEDDPRLSGGIG